MHFFPISVFYVFCMPECIYPCHKQPSAYLKVCVRDRCHSRSRSRARDPIRRPRRFFGTARGPRNAGAAGRWRRWVSEGRTAVSCRWKKVWWRKAPLHKNSWIFKHAYSSTYILHHTLTHVYSSADIHLQRYWNYMLHHLSLCIFINEYSSSSLQDKHCTAHSKVYLWHEYSSLINIHYYSPCLIEGTDSRHLTSIQICLQKIYWSFFHTHTNGIFFFLHEKL